METPPIPKWLKRIQENSWEPEILISGGAIFVLFNLSEWFLNWHTDFIHFFNIHFAGNAIVLLTFLTAIEALKIMFLIHLILRGFWTGVVSVSFVFPKSITGDSLGYKGKFKTLIDREANLANFILKLEKACSLAFAFSIRTVLAVLGLGVLFLTVFIPAAYYSELKILGYLYISLLIIYLIDGVLMGYLRKQTWSVGWYYPIYQLFSVITLSFLYRRLILALLNNLKPKVMAPIGFVIIGLSFYLAYVQFNSRFAIKFYYAGNLLENIYNLEMSQSIMVKFKYLNRWEEGDIKPHVQLERDLVADYPSQLIFIEYNAEFDRFQTEPVTPNLFIDNFFIQIGDSLLSNNFLTMGQNPVTKRLGLIGYINVNWLPTGKHMVKVYSKVPFFSTNLNNKNELGYLYGAIVFWKE